MSLYAPVLGVNFSYETVVLKFGQMNKQIK